MIPERGKIRFRKPAIVLFATLAALAALSPAGAQPYPNHAIKLVVPYSAGSGADITARQTMAKLSGILGQNIVIENRPGASGMTGTDSVARAAPDGYTLLFGVTQHAINPGLYRKLPYDTLADFAAVARVTSQPLFLGVPTSLPAKSVAELVDYVKAHPGKLNYASTGIGTSIHLAGAFFAFKAALEMSHVPYTNASQAIADLGRGEVQVLFYTHQPLIPQVDAGRVRISGHDGCGALELGAGRAHDDRGANRRFRHARVARRVCAGQHAGRGGRRAGKGAGAGGRRFRLSQGPGAHRH